jgi:hypothetical protein
VKEPVSKDIFLILCELIYVDNNTHPLVSFKLDWKEMNGMNGRLIVRSKAESGISNPLYDFCRSLSSSQFTFSAHSSYHNVSFCNAPKLHYTQGHFFSDWRTVSVLYPVLSLACGKDLQILKLVIF